MTDDQLFDVRDRVIVITGACGRIGRVLSEALVARGAKLMMADRAASRPHDRASALGASARGCAFDVSNASEVEALRCRTAEEFGAVDVLINAHQHKPEGFLSASAEEFPERLWDEIIDVNLKGTFLTCRAFGATMLEHGSGSIINFASAYGVVSSNPSLYDDNTLGNPVAYSASKGGVVMLSKYLGVHWASRGVRVNCLTPHGIGDGFEETFERRFERLSPMGRVMEATEIVGAVLFLASAASSYVTGTNLLVDGGWTAW